MTEEKRRVSTTARTNTEEPPYVGARASELQLPLQEGLKRREFRGHPSLVEGRVTVPENRDVSLQQPRLSEEVDRRRWLTDPAQVDMEELI